MVIDVRTPFEYRSGHVEGAKLIDLSSPDFMQKVEALDRDQTYYLYCRSGSRSGQAVRMMKTMGFEKAHNIGGLNALARAGVKVVVPQ